MLHLNKGLIAVSAIALVALSVLGFSTYNWSARKAALAHQSALKQEEVRDFGILENYLLGQVDSLQNVYNRLTGHGKITAQLAGREAILKKINAEHADIQGINTLKSNIEALLKLKESLETDIQKLQSRMQS